MLEKQNFVQCPFVVAIDTREQNPWSFNGNILDNKKQKNVAALPIKVETQRATLKTGDYSIIEPADCRTIFSIERKDTADFFGTLIRNRERFIAELARLNEMEAAHIIVESDWLQIFNQAGEHTRAHPKTVHRSYLAWTLDFPNVHWHFFGNRHLAELSAFRLMQLFFKRKGEGSKRP